MSNFKFSKYLYEDEHEPVDYDYLCKKCKYLDRDFNMCIKHPTLYSSELSDIVGCRDFESTN
jgi:hypothetical protein